MSTAAPLIRAEPLTNMTQHVWNQPLTVTFHFANERVYNLFVKVILNPSTLVPSVRPYLYTLGLVVAITAGLAAIALGSAGRGGREARAHRSMTTMLLVMLVGYFFLKLAKPGSRI